MTNRQPTPGKEGRMLITPEDGSTPFYATITMADDPIEAGDPLSKETLLKDATCDVLGLPTTAVPDDALMQLVLPPGKYAVKITVTTPGGRPLPGVTISALKMLNGETAVTGSDGTVVGYTTSQTVTLNPTHDYTDIKTIGSKSVTLAAGVLNTYAFATTRVSETSKTYSSSTKARFSPDVNTFDASAIGGGANGGAGTQDYQNVSGTGKCYVTGGKGGNAGAVANRAGITNDCSPITITVGAVGGTSKVGSYITAAGAAGASGGAGAYIHVNWSGNGAATVEGSAAAGNGADSDAFLYPPTSVGGAGAGGGALEDTHGGDNTMAAGTGGSPGGGNGGTWGSKDGADGSLPGSGGGGGVAAHSMTSDDTDISKWGSGGAGKAGLCGLVWRYKA